MVSKREIIKTIGEKADEHGLNLVVDPVMVSATGSPLLEKEALDELKNLVNKAKIVTPNIKEAEELSGLEIKTVEEMEKAAKKISKLGPEAVLVKGGHLDTENIYNLLHREGETVRFEEPRISAGEIHGTGCTFSAAITGFLAKGENLETAVRKGGEFMVDAVKGRIDTGEGAEIVNPMARNWKITRGSPEVMEVQRAAKNLAESPEFGRLIPEVGTNIAMAPKNAEERKDVVGLTGRIVKVDERPHLSGTAAPEGSEHVANIVLTAMKHDKNVRAGMNIKFSEAILKACRNMGLKMSRFDREKEPEDVKTMKWGTEKAIRKIGEVPDAIYDRGAIGKEPMIRLLGEKASKVSKIALQIPKRMKSEK